MNNSLKKYKSFLELKQNSSNRKSKVEKAVLQEKLTSFFELLRQATYTNSKSRINKSATRNHQ